MSQTESYNAETENQEWRQNTWEGKGILFFFSFPDQAFRDLDSCGISLLRYNWPVLLYREQNSCTGATRIVWQSLLETTTIGPGIGCIGGV